MWSTQCISLGTLGSAAFNLIGNNTTHDAKTTDANNPDKGVTLGYRTSVRCPDGINYAGIDLRMLFSRELSLICRNRM